MKGLILSEITGLHYAGLVETEHVHRYLVFFKDLDHRCRATTL